MSISIITLSPDRWQEYKAIRVEAIKSDPQAFGRSLEQTNAETDEFWQNRLAEVERGESYLFFARFDHAIIGMMGAYFPKNKADTAHIMAVFVKPEFRNMGVATKLLEHLIAVLKSDVRVATIELAVSIDQVEAFNLYKKFGFVKVGVIKNIMGDGKEHEEYEMILQI